MTARSQFPFDDTFRAPFPYSRLPTQNKNGEIMPIDFADYGIKKLDLDDAPSVPWWRKKENEKTPPTPQSTASTEQSSSSENESEAPISPPEEVAVEPTVKINVNPTTEANISATEHLSLTKLKVDEKHIRQMS